MAIDLYVDPSGMQYTFTTHGMGFLIINGHATMDAAGWIVIVGDRVSPGKAKRTGCKRKRKGTELWWGLKTCSIRSMGYNCTV